MSDDWNRCPACNELVDVDECFDGSEYECANCDLRVVATDFFWGMWNLCCAEPGAERLIRERDEARETIRMQVDFVQMCIGHIDGAKSALRSIEARHPELVKR